MNRLWIMLATVAAILLGARQACAMQAAEATAELSSTTATLGEWIQLTVSWQGEGQPDPPQVPEVDGLTIEFRGQSSRTEMKFDGMRATSASIIAFQYSVAAHREGEFVIPPITVIVDGRAYQTNPVRFRASTPEQSRDIALVIDVDNLSPYVGEPVTLTITLGLARDARSVSFDVPRLEDDFEVFPAAPPPSNRQKQMIPFLGGAAEASWGEQRIDGVDYATLTFRRTIIPRRAGRISLGPASVSASLVMGSRQEGIFFEVPVTRTFGARSQEISLDVRPLPEEGRPPGFTGLVGKYSISASASPTEVNVGDPISLTVVVQGSQPIDRVPNPDLRKNPEFESGFRVGGESPSRRVERQALVVEQVIRPATDEVTRIPPVELTYFDVESGAYQTARSDPIPVKVRPTRVVTADDAQGASGIGVAAAPSALESVDTGIRANIESPSALRAQPFQLGAALRAPGTIAALAAPPLVYGASLVVFALRRCAGNAAALRRRRAAAAALAALEQREGDAPSKAAGALRQYLADRFGRSGPALTPADAAALVSTESPQLAERVRDLLNRCDAARFGGASEADERMLDEARDLIRLLDRPSSRKQGRRAETAGAGGRA